ncbi:sugar phosphate isomerase/epimerase family protein [Tichowtungia aerotolerans]|uniref:TIM barrel protein n=1 Tax=Tichowtungia aerotolerans TaxID=2697043 RepID=A0A6P1M9T5_9BACT|nr:TIM barrel protein [Tichowtungia aerotolerans]QHI69833.1 TIM barrel protein [Tichowtungia aerotolerans]
MKLNEYVKLGLNHHLLFYDVIQEDSRAHFETLEIVAKDPRLEILDMWVPEDEPFRSKTIDLMKSCGKELFYNCGNRAGKPSLAPGSFDDEKWNYTRDVYRDELERAKAISATKIITNSGPNNLEQREAAFERLVDFYVELCRQVPDVLVLIEPTDWDVSKKKLIGSSKEAVDICRRVHDRGFPNMASMVDMCHVPLMHETLAQALSDTGEYLGHIHLGNCILKDRTHPLFGDKHVPLAIEEGEYGVDDLAELFRLGIKSGYFSKGQRGSASIEMRVMGGEDPLDALDRYYSMTEEAWAKVVGSA